MALKIFKGVWFFSLMGLLVVFFYVYAGLPQDVALWQEGSNVSVSRNALFYISLLLMALINVLVFMVRGIVGQKDQRFITWFYGLIISVNLFFIASLGLLNVFNGGERYNYNSMAPAIYGSLILICFWIVSWPVYLLSKKILPK